MAETDADALRARVGAARVSRAQLAERSGIARATLYNFLAGAHAPSPRTLERLAAALDRPALESTAQTDPGLAAKLDTEARRIDTLRGSVAERADVVAQALQRTVLEAADLPSLADHVAARLAAAVQHAAGGAPARLALARARLEQGRYDETIALTGEIAAADRVRWPIARWIAAEALRMQGRWDEAAAAVSDGLRSRDPAVRAWCHWNRAKIHEKRGRVRLARVDLGRALRLARAHGVGAWEAADITAWTHWARAWMALRAEAPDEALRAFAQAAAAAPAGDAGVQVWIAHGLAQLLVTTGELDDARALYTAARRLCRTLGNPHYVAWMDVGLAEIALVQGACVPAVAQLDAAVAAYDEAATENAPNRRYAAGLRAFAAALAGTQPWADAASAIARERAAAERTDSVSVAADLRLLEAEAHRLAGAPARAAALFREAARRFARERLRMRRAHAWLGLATALASAERRRAPAAVAAMRRARSAYERWDMRWGLLRCALVEASFGREVDGTLRRAAERYPQEAAWLALEGRTALPALVFNGG